MSNTKVGRAITARHKLTAAESERGRTRAAERRNAARNVRDAKRRAWMREDAQLYATYMDLLEGGADERTVDVARQAWKTHGRELEGLLPVSRRCSGVQS